MKILLMISYKALIRSFKTIICLRMKEVQYLQKEKFHSHTFKHKIFGSLKPRDLTEVEVYTYSTS